MDFKPFEELNITDDFMFKKVMENREICQELIERLLHIKVEKLEYPELEKTIMPYYTGKGIRLDVYVKDSDRVFDIEIQTYRHEALGKRCRFYQSMIDCDSLIKGNDYRNLKESYILFICTDFPFVLNEFKKDVLSEEAKQSLPENLSNSDLNSYIRTEFSHPVYTFYETCTEDPRINLGDKSVKVIYNASEYEKESDEKIRGFLKYIKNLTPDDDFTDKINEIIEKIKAIEANKTEYMKLNIHDSDKFYEGLQKGKAAGLIEGANEKAIEAAKNLLKMNILTIEQIAQAEGLPVEDVQKLAQGL